MTRWKFFLGSTTLGGALLFKAGAPMVPLALGVAAAAAMTWRRRRASAAGRR
jgi:hypothetical protein